MWMTDFEEQVRTLYVRSQVYDVVQQYFRGIDQRDRDSVIDCFTDDATMNYDEREIGPGRDAIRAFFVESKHSGISLEREMVASSHLSSNFSVQIDGDVATADTCIVAYLLRSLDGAPPDQMLVRGVRYLDRLREDVDDKWRIERRVHTVDWMFEATLTLARLREERVFAIDQI
jgi:hypothetical protein